MHLFPYSKRDGTVAANYKMLDPEVVKNRVVRATELRDKLKKKYKIFDKEAFKN